ncbi:hypothetical protein FOPE_12256 [Fonsecaea pedrosoi]|nr:hypothetical protein FOPE_12256 [Fonsecaea pedrosoi]
MPTILTPQGWVKVAPPPPRKRPVNHDPKAVFRGPLAYLACQRSKPPPLNIGGGGNVKGRAEFPYDLSASPEKLRRQGEVNARSKADRSVSAPVMHGGLHPRDDDYDEYDDEVEDIPAPEVQRRRPRTPKSIEQPKPKSKSSPQSQSRSSQHHSHHHNDRPERRSHTSSHSRAPSSPSSSSTSSSSASSRSSAPSSRSSASSVSSAHSTKSYHRPAPPGHSRRPSVPAAAPAANPYYSMPRYDHYPAPPGSMPMPMPIPMHVPMPMPAVPAAQPVSSGKGSGGARSLSYSWYNATTPLKL